MTNLFAKDELVKLLAKLYERSVIIFSNLSKENKRAYVLLLTFFLICYNTGLITLFGALIAVYAVFFNTMSNEYNARSSLIADLTNKATDHLKAFQDGTLALQAIQMQLLPKPHYFQIYDVLTYKPNRTEYSTKRLRIEIDKREGYTVKFRIYIASEEANNKSGYICDYKEIDERKYLSEDKIGMPIVEWVKIYEMLDIRAHSAEFIKKYIVGMKKSGFGKIDGESNLQDIWLHGANLQGAKLERANLQGTNLHGADLTGANLQEANLQESYLQGAILQEACLQRANLERSNLQEANLIVTDLRGARLYGANFQRTNLSFSNLRETNIENTNFREAKFRQTDFTKAHINSINDKITLEEVLLSHDLFEEYKEELPIFSNLAQLEGAIFHKDIGLPNGIDEKMKKALIEVSKWRLDFEQELKLTSNHWDYRLSYRNRT